MTGDCQVRICGGPGLCDSPGPSDLSDSHPTATHIESLYVRVSARRSLSVTVDVLRESHASW